MGALGWPLLLLALGLVCLVAEVFVPSGGSLGLLALGCLGYGLWLAFELSIGLGLRFLAADAILLPVASGLGLYYWPRTSLAKRLFLKPPTPDEIEVSHAVQQLEHLIGQYGRAVTPLRPSGSVDFEGRRLEGQAEEGLIAPGTLVQVVRVRSGRVVVRAARETLPEES